MRVHLKTTKGDSFEVEINGNETFLALKQKVQQLHGHALQLQKLCFHGRILKDTEIVSSYNTEKGDPLKIFVSPSTTPTYLQPAAGPIQLTPSSDFTTSQAIEMGFPRDKVVATMNVTGNDFVQAIEYLASNGTYYNPYDREDSTAPLDFLLKNPVFPELRTMLQKDPTVLALLLQRLRATIPKLATLIENNEESFMQLINGSASPAQRCSQVESPSDPASVSPSFQMLTSGEIQQVQEIAEMGFSQQDVVEAYINCDKDMGTAVDLLLMTQQSLNETGNNR